MHYAEGRHMTKHNCSTCNQSFNSDRELQEHQEHEHSGKQQDSNRSDFAEPSTGEQAERQEKIA
jgi:hypothetical protein